MEAPRLVKDPEKFEVWIKEIVMRIPSSRNKTAKEFMDYLLANSLAQKTRMNYAQMLTWLDKTPDIGDRDYKDLTKEDLMEFARLLDRGMSNGSVKLYRTCAKKFFQWVHFGEDAERGKYPKVVSWMKNNGGGNQKRKLPKHLPKVKIRKLAEAANNQRDRTLAMVGYDSGCRPGELLGLQIGDVAFDKYGAVIRVDGKTGVRRIRLFDSVPDLTLWLNMHQDKDNPEATLWPGFSHPSTNEVLDYTGYKSMFIGLRDRARLPRWVTPHVLRHSRATHLAGDLTEPQMRELFGWEKNSMMPAVYVHLSGRDVDKALLKIHGIVEEDEEQKEEDYALKPVKCPRCGTENPAGFKFCGTCSMILDAKTAMELEKTGDQAAKLVMRDPEQARKALFVMELLEMAEKVGLDKVKAKMEEL